MAGFVLDSYMVYQFLKRLVIPFEKWDAYKLGIIDENGKVLKKRKNLLTIEERSAWNHFDIMIANLKKLLGKFPAGKTRIASYAAALLLIKEHENRGSVDQENLIEELQYEMKYVRLNNTFRELRRKV